MRAEAGKVAGIGVDLLRVERVARAYARHGQRFAQRILGMQELEKFQRRYERDPDRGIRFLATRFAAKEACLKALKTGWRGKITWHDIEIVSGDGGAPQLEIRGEAEKIFRSLGANKIHLSMSHTTDHAVAQVVFEKI